MPSKRIKFIPHEKTDLEKIQYTKRIDWINAGGPLFEKTVVYKNNYRKKICSKCSIEQQTKRKCVRYVINGKKLTSCGHMDSACGSMFKEEFDEWMDSALPQSVRDARAADKIQRMKLAAEKT